ncbi:hypothetical protein EJ03DRAFT_256940, partial [Teratosphaeria nubilosa]
KTIWEGGLFKLEVQTQDEYPTKLPEAASSSSESTQTPHAYSSDTVCLSILHEAEGWMPATTGKEILVGIEMLLDLVDLQSPVRA